MFPTFLTWRLQGLQNLSSGLQGLHRPHLSNSGEEIQEPQLAATAEQTEQAAAPPTASTFSFWPLSESQPTLSKLVSIDSSQMGRRSASRRPQPSGKREKVNLIITQTHNSGRPVRRRRVALRGNCEMRGAVPILQKRELSVSGCGTSAKVSPLAGQKARIQAQIWAHSTPAHCHPGRTHCGNLKNESIH